jgi:hypothetical protein
VVRFPSASCSCSSDEVLSRHGLKAIGDGVLGGKALKNTHKLAYCGHIPTYEFDCYTWTWHVGGEQSEKEASRYLNRLDVLKELFNVFINRAVGLCLVFACAL